jgi:hypothetical protein
VIYAVHSTQTIPLWTRCVVCSVQQIPYHNLMGLKLHSPWLSECYFVTYVNDYVPAISLLKHKGKTNAWDEKYAVFFQPLRSCEWISVAANLQLFVQRLTFYYTELLETWRCSCLLWSDSFKLIYRNFNDFSVIHISLSPRTNCSAGISHKSCVRARSSQYSLACEGNVQIDTRIETRLLT